MPLIKDHQHVLQCSHPSRSKWRKDPLKKLSNKCAALSTKPVLKSIFLNGIRCWLENREFNEGGIPLAYQTLLDEQRKIGWYQVFLACMSLQWSITQSQHLLSLKSTSTSLTGPSWTKAMCTIITTEWLDLWDQQNTDCHGKELSHKAIAACEQAIHKITILSSYKNKILQRDHAIFLENLEALCHHPTSQLCQWINSQISYALL
jgi:hypothetical protein